MFFGLVTTHIYCHKGRQTKLKIQAIWKAIENFAKLSLLKQFRENCALKKEKTANAHKKELGWCRAPHLNAEREKTLKKSD